MIDCLILGDSIALGIGERRPECVVEAYVGAPSAAYAMGGAWQADLVIISLGSNDRDGSTHENLMAMRQSVRASRVIWILPGRNRAAVESVARLFGDGVARIPEFSRDGIHPTPRAYASLGRTVR